MSPNAITQRQIAQELRHCQGESDTRIARNGVLDVGPVRVETERFGLPVCVKGQGPLRQGHELSAIARHVVARRHSILDPILRMRSTLVGPLTCVLRNPL